MCGICLKLLSQERVANPSEVLSTSLVFLFTLALGAAPIYLLVVSIRLYRAVKAEDKPLIDKYKSLFENKRITSLGTIMYNLMFFLRRYSMIFTMVIYPNLRLFQIFGTIVLSIIYVIYTMTTMPFLEPQMNRQELFNEVFILISSYFLLMYTEWTQDDQTRYSIGWLSAGSICLNVLVNIGFMVVEQFHKCRLRCRRCQNRIKAKKRDEELRKRREQLLKHQ